MIEATILADRAKIRPPPGLFPGAIVRPPVEAVQLTSGIIQTTGDKIDWGGNTTRRSLETDPNTTICISDIPSVGEQLVTQWTKHAFFWTDGHGRAILLPTDDITRIRSLSDEPRVLYASIPGGLQPADVFERPDDTILIHMGVDTSLAMVEEIKDRAGVANIINIQVGKELTSDAWRWPQFVVTYDGLDVKMFPVSGDDYQSFPAGNITSEKTAAPLYVRFSKYVQNGGAIPWPFMRDAYTLPNCKMQEKYPRNQFYIEGPEYFERQLEQVARETGIQFTPNQRRAYANLRLIPIEHQQMNDNTYSYGPKYPKNGASIAWDHPANMGEVGLAGHLVIFDGDPLQKYLLEKYIERQELRRSLLA